MKCKLLVAEDELIERKVLCRTLQKYLGDLICLYEAKNGREALEIFAREAPQARPKPTNTGRCPRTLSSRTQWWNPKRKRSPEH